MRGKFFGMMVGGALALMAAGIAGCGTNEKNYRTAYEKAKEKGGDGVESTIYNRVREQAQSECIVIAGDTIDAVKEYVTVAKDAGFTHEQLKRYNVVVAQFKQLFHAKSMRGRMEKGGYGNAIVVETGEPLYYVVAVSTSSLQEAKAVADSISENSPVKLADGFPWILRAANR